MYEKACYLVPTNRTYVARHRKRNKLRARLRAFRTFKYFAWKDSRTTEYTHEVLAKFHAYAADHNPTLTYFHYLRAQRSNTANTPASPPTKLLPSKQNANTSKQNANSYHHLNCLNRNDSDHDDPSP